MYLGILAAELSTSDLQLAILYLGILAAELCAGDLQLVILYLGILAAELCKHRCPAAGHIVLSLCT